MKTIDRWPIHKTESKIAFLALILSLITLGYTEIKNYVYSEAERKRSDIKLNMIKLLSDENSLSRSEIVKKYNSKFSPSLKQESLNQALYEALKDGVVVFTHDTKTYEVSSYYSIHKEPQVSKSKIKLNIINLFSLNNRLTASEIINAYKQNYNVKIEDDIILEGLYETLKDGVVVFTNDTKTYELKSFTSMH